MRARTLAAEQQRPRVEASVYEAPDLLSAPERGARVRIAWLLDACLLLRTTASGQADPPAGVARPTLDPRRIVDVFERAPGAVVITRTPEAAGLDLGGSNDRYANMQTKFLLSRIETFNGVTILTTNRDSAIDAALMRRLTFRVYVPMPEHAERVALWRTCLAGQALADVDLDELASALEMSGGDIRSASVRGGDLAAAAPTRGPGARATRVIGPAETIGILDRARRCARPRPW